MNIRRFFAKSRIFLNRNGTGYKSVRDKFPRGTFTNAVQLNAEPGDSKIRIVPVGEFPEHPDGPHEITRQHLEQMVKNTKTDIMVDLGHEAIWNPSAPAYGWIALNSLEVREDGLYSNAPEFTPDAADMVKNRKYRFLSPAYTLMNRDKQGRQVGAKLLPVSLVNRPYMDEEVSHLNADQQKEDAAMEYTAEFKKKIGLAEDASDEQVDAKLDDLVKTAEKVANQGPEGEQSNSAQQEDKDGVDEKEEEEAAVANTEVEKRLKALEEREQNRELEGRKQTAETLVNSAIAEWKILPADKEVWLNAAIHDFDGTKKKLDERKANAARPGKVQTGDAGTETGAKRNALQEATEYFKSFDRRPQAAS